MNQTTQSNAFWIMAFSSLILACGDQKKFRAKTIPNCSTQSEVGSYDFHFIMDNSGSNLQSDPSFQRARSIESIATTLKGFEHEIDVGIVSFPHPDTADKGAKIQLPLQALKGVSDEVLRKSLEFIKSPFGWTPYGDAFIQTSKSIRPKKNSAVFFITDGLATDSDPNFSLSEIQKLYEGIPIFSILLVEPRFVLESENITTAWQAARQDHKTVLQDKLNMTAEDAHKNIDLLENISESIDFISDWQAMDERLKKLMSKHMGCQF